MREPRLLKGDFNDGRFVKEGRFNPTFGRWRFILGIFIFGKLYLREVVVAMVPRHVLPFRVVSREEGARDFYRYRKV